MHTHTPKTWSVSQLALHRLLGVKQHGLPNSHPSDNQPENKACMHMHVMEGSLISFTEFHSVFKISPYGHVVIVGR